MSKHDIAAELKALRLHGMEQAWEELQQPGQSAVLDSSRWLIEHLLQALEATPGLALPALARALLQPMVPTLRQVLPMEKTGLLERVAAGDRARDAVRCPRQHVAARGGGDLGTAGAQECNVAHDDLAADR